ncbi:MAG: hypothetical protein OIF48_11110 [Silicimonas sp.]|nr:hypothetical protein [Silicimonas sp.]
MTEASYFKGADNDGVPSLLWETVAREALEAVASKPPPATGEKADPVFDPAWVREIADAAHDPQLTRIGRIIDGLLEHGVAPLAIIETYCAEAARLLGEDWHFDRLSFAQVSIGTARLQGVVRALYASLPPQALDHGAQVAVILRDCEQHTLGPIILANKLRLAGHTAWLAAGFSDEEILERLSRQRFDMVLCSVSQERNLANLDSFLQTVRDRCDNRLDIALGGSFLDRCGSQAASDTGADMVTSDIQLILDRLADRSTKARTAT